MLAVVNLPDPETALALWAGAFGLLTGVSLLAYQIIERFQQEERKRRKLALAAVYEREISRSRTNRSVAA